MPAVALLLPPALLAFGAAAGWALELTGVKTGRLPAAVGTWLALAALALVWQGAGRVPLELAAGTQAAGVPLGLRLDVVALAFALCVLVPAALLITFQQRSGEQAALAALTTAASLVAVQAGNLLLTALAAGSCASLAMIILLHEHPHGCTGYWLAQVGAWLGLVWAAVVFESRAGTSDYAAVPVAALDLATFALLAAAAALISGLLPWRSWISQMLGRPQLEAGALAVAAVWPLGFYVLARAYAMGAGHWPYPWLNGALAVLGTGGAAGAAIRGQAASTLRQYLAEALPFTGGLALLGMALGTPAGLAAGVTMLLGGSLLAGLGPLLLHTGRPMAIAGLAAVAGLPPTLMFGGRILVVQVAYESGPAGAFLGLAATAVWLLAIAGAARAVRLPVGALAPAGSSAWGARLGLGAAIVGGAAVGLLTALVAGPAAAELAGVTQPSIGGGLIAASTASGAWPAVALGLPAIALITGLGLLSRPAWAGLLKEPHRPAAQLFAPPLAGLPEKIWERLAGFRVSEQYASLVDPLAIEAAMTRARPWLWAAVAMAVAIVVAR